MTVKHGAEAAAIVNGQMKPSGAYQADILEEFAETVGDRRFCLTGILGRMMLKKWATEYHMESNEVGKGQRTWIIMVEEERVG
jgi:hypothetical protein